MILRSDSGLTWHSFVLFVVGSLVGIFAVTGVFADDPPAAGGDAILERLRGRALERPTDGAAWRLLGRAMLDRGQITEAQAALEKAVKLSPESIAAWYDLGRVHAAAGRPDQANDCFETAIQLDPGSEYAEKARSVQRNLNLTESETPGVEQAGYATRTFDGTEFLDQLDDTDPPIRSLIKDRLDLRLETGFLYNSNVALAPLSRQLAPGNRESFQWFVAPDVQLGLFDEGSWRTGPTLRGQFTLNEDEFRRFNLQSYRPGWFAEWFFFRGERIIVPRVAYEFTYDRFGGDTLGNRHALLTSLGTYWDDVHATFLFYSAEQTNFLDDGILPEVTSQDGWTNTLGVSHDVLMPYANLRLLRAGADLSRADTDGTDYSYNGFNTFLEGVFPLAPTWELTLVGSWGLRDYFDFEFEPSRNEDIWRAAAELRKRLNENMSLAAVFNYQKFDSENPLFAAERYLGGLQLELEY